jgi:acyl-CoA dehydrogenase
MRTIGVAEEAIEAMAKRLVSRVAFGKRLSDHSVWEQRIARARIDIEMTRLLCLKAADMMDKAGNKAAQLEIAMIKVQAPTMALQIIDDAIQAHGGAGVSGDFGLAHDWAGIRTLRLADGPDEVHNRAIARASSGNMGTSRRIGPGPLSGDRGSEPPVKGFRRGTERRRDQPYFSKPGSRWRSPRSRSPSPARARC